MTNTRGMVVCWESLHGEGGVYMSRTKVGERDSERLSHGLDYTKLCTTQDTHIWWIFSCYPPSGESRVRACLEGGEEFGDVK